jgi:hypothetical protein
MSTITELNAFLARETGAAAAPAAPVRPLVAATNGQAER